MKFRVPLYLVLVAILVTAAGCSAPRPKLTYAALPDGGTPGAGFPFVVPRTAVRVAPSFDKGGALEGVNLTPVPMAGADDGKTPLPAFVATDSSTGGWAFAPTTLSSVKYVDELIVSEIGTQVTDNRKDVLGVLVTAASLGGAFALTKDSKKCDGTTPLKPFVIEATHTEAGAPAKDVECWGYSVTLAKFNPVARKRFDVKEIASIGTVEWFPIAACKSYVVSVYPCADKSCKTPMSDKQVFVTTLPLSDGTQYQRVPLPAKGKITLHTDFCGADTTDEAGATDSDWSLLKQFLSDVKSEKEKAK
ncbi:hypothetical protein QTH91_15965 [Variovorax dokdonensis]|uniref:Lipoprotein n=1 Tax=Variovorax dokdonensis TaxID=344883 RepID=A0ABT7NDQ0_9BURK|nr:hypothetical protein [Variovorax dokdonensis]MDM0045985.1 hypothetical protein [Variovorax dokdonensis]